MVGEATTGVAVVEIKSQLYAAVHEDVDVEMEERRRHTCALVAKRPLRASKDIDPLCLHST